MAKINNNDIASAIYSSLKDKSNVELTSATKQVVSFLHRRRLLDKSDNILTEVAKIMNKDQGNLEATVSSASPLNDKIKNEIMNFLKSKFKVNQVLIKEKINKLLLGGYRIEVEDQVIDLSMRSRINRLQEHLTTPQ